MHVIENSIPQTPTHRLLRCLNNNKKMKSSGNANGGNNKRKTYLPGTKVKEPSTEPDDVGRDAQL